jgi:hypothetical protein
MALVGHSEQRAAVVRLGFPQLMPQSLIEGGREELAFHQWSAISNALRYGGNGLLT